MIDTVRLAYQKIITDHADEDGVVAIVAHGGSIAWTMPEFTGNVTLPFAIVNGLNNTGIVQVELFRGQPFVTNWQGTPIDWPGQQMAAVPLPASLPLLLIALGGMAAVGHRRQPV